MTETDTALSARADALLALHRPGDPVVLPTVWDAWSASLAAEAGFAGLTVGSHPVAESVGRADNEGMTFEELLTRLRQIIPAVDVPVSVDIESGYGQEPARLIEGLLEVGAVGLNLEDTVHSQGGRRREPQEHADLVGALRAVADESGVHVVINARTDVLLRVETTPERVADAIDRLGRAAKAGADVLYPVGVHPDEVWQQLVASLPLPLNAIAHPADDDLAHFKGPGIGRISFGPRLQAALTDQARTLLTAWR
jgi:2-methylisocitrate lyase-like PEP mutase family enzyme